MKLVNRDQAFNSGSNISSLPPQAIPTKRKNKEWIKRCADALEAIGMSQMRDNAKFKDFYRMKGGKLSYMEISDVMPHLKDMQGSMDNLKIPSFIKHYDLTGGIINAFEGWLSNMQDKYMVTEIGDLGINEYEDSKSTLMQSFVGEMWDVILNQKLVQKGLDPNLNDFSTDEERQAYINMVQEAKVSMMPPEIEDFMNTRWKTQASKWGDDTLEADRSRFYMDEIDKENFIDYLLTGKCFRNHFVGFDYYKPERWSPVEVFHPTDENNKYPQNGGYIGRITYMDGTSIIARYGHKLSDKQKKMIMGYEDSLHDGVVDYNRDSYKKRKMGITGMYENQVIPWDGYHDYMSIVNAEDHFGIPIGIRHSFDNEGKEVLSSSFMPRLNNLGYDPYVGGSFNDISCRGKYRVMEGYWVSMKPIYVITYMTETGMTTQEIVTDELMREFLEDHGIKKIKKVMADVVEDPEVNTYIMEYLPEVRFVTKMSGGSLEETALYIYGDPIPYQIHGDSSLYDYLLPVSGFLGVGIAPRIQPWQMLFNLNMNQMYNMMEKEIGKFSLVDPGFLPSHYKDMDGPGGLMATFMDIVKSTGFMVTGGAEKGPLDRSDNSNHNKVAVVDMSLSDMISIRAKMAMYAYDMAHKMIGITPQSLGAPSTYETSTGVKQGVTASLLQTQTYFNDFDSFKKRTLDIHLAVAQVCQKKGMDWTVMYRKSDLSLSYLNLTDDDLSLRHLCVMAIANSKKRMELENMKQFILQTNTLGNDLMDYIRLIGANSDVELNQIGRDSRRHMERKEKDKYDREKDLISREAESKKEIESLEHEHAKELLNMKIQGDLKGKAISAAGNAVRKDSGDDGYGFVSDMTEKALRNKEMDSNMDIQNRKMDIDKDMNERRLELEERKADQKDRELNIRGTMDRTRRFTSVINKR